MASLHKGGLNTRSMVTLPPLVTSDEVKLDEQDNDPQTLMLMTTTSRKFNAAKERMSSKPKDDSVEAMVQENPKFSKPGGIATKKIKAEDFIYALNKTSNDKVKSMFSYANRVLDKNGEYGDHYNFELVPFNMSDS